MGGVRTSWLVLMVAVYVSLDLANPLMPGALSFGIEDSVELRQAERFRAHEDATVAPAVSFFERVERTEHDTLSGIPAADLPRRRSLQLPRTRSALSTRPAPAPDH